MCSSKPKIPNSKTPPAPLAPEAAPDAPLIGGERRGFYRSRGLAIPTRPDLRGLGNQTVGTPDLANTLFIGPGAGSTPRSAIQIAEDNIRAEQEQEARQAASTANRRRGYRR